MTVERERQIVLDTETTGLEVGQGHRVIEIGCIELVKRRFTRNDFHQYLNPEREIDEGAVDVHGLTPHFLASKPRFAEIAHDLWAYLEGAELLIHNAPFDVGFLDSEFAKAGFERKLSEVCLITDTLALARRQMPGQRVSLDALCKRFSVDNSGRDFHGALLDARLLADVFLTMTGGQSDLGLVSEQGSRGASRFVDQLGPLPQVAMPVVVPSEAEWAAHRARLKVMAKTAPVRWQNEGG